MRRRRGQVVARATRRARRSGSRAPPGPAPRTACGGAHMLCRSLTGGDWGARSAAPRHASAGLRAWRTLGSDACVQRERIGPASGAPQTSAAARGGNSLSWARTRVRTRFGLNAQRETFSDAVREGPHRSAFAAWRPRWVHRTAPFASSRREGESITKGGFASGGQQPKLPHRSLPRDVAEQHTHSYSTQLCIA